MYNNLHRVFKFNKILTSITKTQGSRLSEGGVGEGGVGGGGGEKRLRRQAQGQSGQLIPRYRGVGRLVVRVYLAGQAPTSDHWSSITWTEDNRGARETGSGHVTRQYVQRCPVTAGDGRRMEEIVRVAVIKQRQETNHWITSLYH